MKRPRPRRPTRSASPTPTGPHAHTTQPAAGDDATRFWERPLETLSTEQWEALCDGCGRCCLHKYEDEDTGALAWSCVSCHLLDTRTGHCSDYAGRKRRVPDCLTIDATMAREVNWLPPTCAYRLRAEDRPLPDWHPLISGDPDSVRRAGVSVAGRVISELEALDVAPIEYIVVWPGQWPEDERRDDGSDSI